MTASEIKKPARKFDADFKAKAVVRYLEAKHNGTPITHLAKEIGVSDSVLYAWAQQAKEANKAGGKKTAKTIPAKPAQQERREYSIELKEQALAMHRSGTSIPDVARELKIPYVNVHYWVRNGVQRGVGTNVTVIPANQQHQPRVVNAAQRDALIYLTHAEKKILDMIRDGKISKPDPAHLLTLLALTSLQEAMGK